MIIDASQLTNDDELFIIKVPEDFPLTELHQSSLLNEKEYKNLRKTLKIKNQKGETERFLMTLLEKDKGECQDMQVILPNSSQKSHILGNPYNLNGYKIDAFSIYFHLFLFLVFQFLPST